jgi:hypothetical protein
MIGACEFYERQFGAKDEEKDRQVRRDAVK